MYCSESSPPEGVYLATTATKLSAKALIEVVKVMNVGEVEGYVPVLMPDTKVEKKGWEIEVTVSEP